jgi:hypothetical protein
MALNPPLAHDGRPMRVQGEFLVLQRCGIEFDVRIPNIGKRNAKGTVSSISSNLNSFL